MLAKQTAEPKKIAHEIALRVTASLTDERGGSDIDTDDEALPALSAMVALRSTELRQWWRLLNLCLMAAKGYDYLSDKMVRQ
jgi:hypothetical protein